MLDSFPWCGKIRVMRKNGKAQPVQSAWKVAEAYGCDMSLIESNLRKTPQERIRAHSRALATATTLRAAMEKRHARS